MAKAKQGYRTIPLELKQGAVVPVYTSARVADALQEISANATLYEGVRLTQLLEAAYIQGKKDGAREVFEQLDRGVAEAKRQIPHRPPERPKKKRR